LINKDLPISIALKIKKNAKLINDEMEIVNGLRQDILNKYKDDKSNVEDDEVGIKENEYEHALKEISELENSDVEINLQKINVSDLEKSDIFIKPSTLALLETILQEDKEEELN